MSDLFRLTAFPYAVGGGNKAGVYINADHLSDEEMQEIAKEVGYSETAFVLKSTKADFKVRFFTPMNEVDLCGHATVATFNLLRDRQTLKPGHFKQETKAGILSLDIREDMVFMEQPAPIFSEIIEESLLRDCFQNLECDKDLPVQVVSTGMREIFLPVKDFQTLNALQPDFIKMIALCQRYNTIGIHAFCLDKEVDAYGRNFAPVVGVNEESATGTSNGALGCYLSRYVAQKNNYILRQGFSMNQPSQILTRLEYHGGMIQKVWVGGTAALI